MGEIGINVSDNVAMYHRIHEHVDPLPGSFTHLNQIKLYEAALLVPRGGLMVEVGVDRGRSASCLMFAAEETGARVVLVDNWVSVLEGNYWKVAEMIATTFPMVDVQVLFMDSIAASMIVNEPIDLIHIDANHEEDGISADCLGWLPKLKLGGIAAFHDYGANGLPAVKQWVDISTKGWEDMGVWDGLAIRRKPSIIKEPAMIMRMAA